MRKEKLFKIYMSDNIAITKRISHIEKLFAISALKFRATKYKNTQQT